MKRFLRRWLQLEQPRAAPATPSDPPSVKRTEYLELLERVDLLEKQLNRLRGSLTGGLAHSPKPREDPEPRQDAPQPTIDPAPIGGAAFDRHMALASHRRAKNGVLPG
jgi:hypothetical protein